MRSSREICRSCWRPSPVGFYVPDAVWEQCVPPALRQSPLCIMCFAALADEREVPWDEDIKFYPVSRATMAE